MAPTASSSLRCPTLSFPTFSYRHRDKPDHSHPAKDWVGLFLLETPPSTATTTPLHEPPGSARDPQGNRSTDPRLEPHAAHSHHPSGKSTAANDDDSESEKDTKAAAEAEAKAGAEGTAGESIEAGPMAGRPATSVVGATATNKDTDPGAHNAIHEVGGSRSQGTRFFRSSQVAAAFVVGVPAKLTATGGAGISTEGEERREKKGMLPGKMVGWRTLPQENEVRANGRGVLILTGEPPTHILPARLPVQNTAARLAG